jgi:hypothetical protein
MYEHKRGVAFAVAKRCGPACLIISRKNIITGSTITKKEIFTYFTT